MDLTIFCPQCHTLLVDAPACRDCRWRRPPPAEAGTQVWQYNAGAKLRCTSLALAGDSLVFGDGGRAGRPSIIHAVEASTGNSLWRTELPLGAASDSLATDGERVYVSATEAGDLSSDKPLFALDAVTGEIAWTYSSQALNLSAPLLRQGTVYVASGDCRLHALDAPSGKRQWVTDISGWGLAAPAAGEGNLFLSADGNRLLALDQSGGSERWSYEGGSTFGATPSVLDGVVYASCWDGTLYALEARTGRLVWRFDLGAHAYLLTSPVISGDRILVGSRDHHLYAVDRASGVEQWRFETLRRVYATPAVAEGTVYVGSDDHHLYALDEETGKPRWKKEMPNRIRTAPLAAAPYLYVACTKGEVFSLALASLEHLRDIESYIQDREYARAGALLVLDGEWSRAAKIWSEYLGQPYQAAQLYERAEEPARAAHEFELAGRPDLALMLWRKAGDTDAVVRILRATDRNLEAAQELEQAGNLAGAAELYDKILNQPAKAADLYRQAGMLLKALVLYAKVRDLTNQVGILLELGRPEDAARRCEKVGEYARAIELYLEAGKPELAAAIWATQDDHGRAAELFEKAGDLLQAISHYEKAQAWSRLVELYTRMGESAKAAANCEKAGDFARAGQLFEEAAAKLEDETRGKEEERLAVLFDKAAQCYHREFENERRDRCRQKVRYYRRQPNLTLVLKQDESFVQDAFNTLTVELINHGRGVAKDVDVALVPAVEGTFAGELGNHIRGIGRFRPRSDTLSVLPKAPGKLSLDVQVRYLDRAGEKFEERIRWFVEVRAEKSSRHFTPQEIHVHGDLVQGKKLEGGDIIEGGGQKGDRVEIQRGGQGRTRLTIGEGVGGGCPDCGAPQSAGAAFCERCGKRLEEKT